MNFLCVLAALAGLACDPVLIGEQTSEGRDDGNAGGDEATTPDDPEEQWDETPLPKTLYVTGVEYPEGVEWQRDIGYDIDGSKLFLMRDGEKTVELTVGYNECVAIDADMHRCIDGHLYTDFSTDDETVVKVDGVEAYRYAGREMVKSMYVHNDVIHTLCVPRDGSAGWKYRRDGEEILSQSSGDLIGGLYEDDGDIVFSYRTGNTYYMFVNNSSTSITFGSTVTDVFDVRRIGGVLNYISANNTTITAMAADTVVQTFGGFTDETDMKIYYDGEDRFYVGSVSGLTGVWREGDVSMRCDSPLAGFSLRGNDYICVIKNDANETESICCSGENRPWQDGTELMYETCIATDGFGYTVGLINRTKDNAPALWKTGAITNYDFNGFFTHVDYW